MTPEALRIRDGALALFETSPLFKFKSHVPVDFEPDDQMPGLVIAIIAERFSADGDLTAAQPRFVAEVELAAVIRVTGNNRPDVAQRLSKRSTAVLAAILRSAAYVASVDGFSDVTMTPRFWPGGEGYFAEEEMRLTVQHRVNFPPIVDDELERILMTTRLAGTEPHTPTLQTEIPTT